MDPVLPCLSARRVPWHPATIRLHDVSGPPAATSNGSSPGPRRTPRPPGPRGREPPFRQTRRHPAMDRIRLRHPRLLAFAAGIWNNWRINAPGKTLIHRLRPLNAMVLNHLVAAAPQRPKPTSGPWRARMKKPSLHSDSTGIAVRRPRRTTAASHQRRTADEHDHRFLKGKPGRAAHPGPATLKRIRGRAAATQ